jgi:hypothetical protein
MFRVLFPFRLVMSFGMGVLLSPWARVQADPGALVPDIQVRHLLDTNPNSYTVRLAKDPRDQSLYLLKGNGDIYGLHLPDGTNAASAQFLYTSSDHGITSAAGFAIGPDGSMYVVGNQHTASDTLNTATVMRGTPDPASGRRSWIVQVKTEPYPRSKTAFDHEFNAVLISPDGQWLYLNSGARTDHGEEQSTGGLFPGTREIALTSTLFRLPTSATNLFLPNNKNQLRAAGYIFAEGVRNTFDLAWAPNGDLFGTENGPDRSMSDELNWLQQGHHYGFPWRMGGLDNPQQFPNYDPAQDPLLDPRFIAVVNGYYHNDPDFPAPPPVAFTEPVVNYGPDADSFRDPQTGEIKDASALGQSTSTFTAHRSPLGLVFDTSGVLTAKYRGHGFMLSWTPGDPSGSSVAGPFEDPSQDLVDLNLVKTNGEYQAHVVRLVGGFSNPIDAEMIGQRLYVVEYGGKQGLWEVLFPTDPVLQVVALSAAKVTFGLSADPGSQIVIESSPDLTHWTVSQQESITSGPIQFSEPLSNGPPALFFRARRTN